MQSEDWNGLKALQVG